MKSNTCLRMALAVSGLVAISACTSLTGKPPMLTSEQPGVLEPIYAAAVTADTAIVRVSSNGCTTKDDLQPYVTREGEDTEMTVRRLRSDTCGTPVEDGVEMQWSFDELGLPHGAPVTVNNPYRLRDIVVKGRRS